MPLRAIVEKISDIQERPSWDEYFMTIACLTSLRSNCVKRKVGSVIVKDNKVLGLGYNGTPVGMINCIDGGCTRCSNTIESGNHLDLCMCLHAEENALMFLGKEQLKDATLYCTLNPCTGCLKKIIQCQIKRIVYKEEYNNTLDTSCKKLCESVGIELYKIEFN